jgi:hypothetical protein
MHYRLLACLLAFSLIGFAETISVEQLSTFIKNAAKSSSDKDVAGYLATVKLSERLDSETILKLKALGAGPKTVQALEKLKSQSQALPAPKPAAPAVAAKPMGPPSAEEQAAVIEAVRQYALNYSKNLPNFLCTLVTRRFGAPKPGTKNGGSAGSDPAFRKLDELLIRLTYFEQKEDYKLIMVNNSVTTQDYKKLGGSTSTGDFGSMMLQIFEPRSEARFEWDHWGLLRGHNVMVFAYHVAQARSQWQITVKDVSQSIVPAYHGLVYVDSAHQVQRVTLVADEIPPDFPVKKASTILDYDNVDISGHMFLLPLRASVAMVNDDYLTRNDEEFRNYNKYSADSVLKFDSDVPPPLPDEKTKETPK